MIIVQPIVSGFAWNSTFSVFIQDGNLQIQWDNEAPMTVRPLNEGENPETAIEQLADELCGDDCF